MAVGEHGRGAGGCKGIDVLLVLRNQLPHWLQDKYLSHLNFGGQFWKVENLLLGPPLNATRLMNTGNGWEDGGTGAESRVQDLWWEKGLGRPKGQELVSSEYSLRYSHI